MQLFSGYAVHLLPSCHLTVSVQHVCSWKQLALEVLEPEWANLNPLVPNFAYSMNALFHKIISALNMISAFVDGW